MAMIYLVSQIAVKGQMTAVCMIPTSSAFGPKVKVVQADENLARNPFRLAGSRAAATQQDSCAFAVRLQPPSA
jgi:hypothetical protein